MWNVNERFSQKAIESLAALGFGVGSTRGVVRVEKYGGGAEFRKEADGQYQMTVQPTIMLKGKFTRLWDAGYQKFLLTAATVVSTRARDEISVRYGHPWPLHTASLSWRRNFTGSTRCFAALREPIKITGMSVPCLFRKTASSSMLTSRSVAPNSRSNGSINAFASSQR